MNTFRNQLAKLGVGIALLLSNVAIAQSPLLTAQNFGVLGGAAVTNTGPSIVNADLGVSPGSSVSGFPPGIIANGTLHAADAVAAQAQTDLTTAYNVLAGLPCTTDLTGQDLGGKTLIPGVYCFPNTSAALTGTLTLDLQNNPDARFVFKVGSTLTTASGSSVVTINGSACNKVFWQIGSSATLGTGSTFAGDILALHAITITTAANSSGRALARNAAVTLDSNNINTCALIAAPTIATIASPGVTLGSGSIFDSATVSGRTAPTVGGTVTFRLYGPNDLNCTNAPVFSPAAVAYPVAGGPVASPSFTPTLAGTYRWIASYSGDGSNPPVPGVCNAPNESVDVAPPGPTITTVASPGIVLGAGSLTDSATVNGRVNPVVGATITFRLYGPDDNNCTNPAVFAPAAVAYPIAGGPVTSPSFTPILAGTYRWIASYSGDANNVAITGLCNAPNESTIVIPPGPAIVTVASPNIVLGAGTLSDTATVTGRVNPVAGATITFRLYGPNDLNCTNPAVFSPAAVSYPSAGGPVTSPSFTPILAGTYRWIASYSGDANNAPTAGVCNAPNESAIVAPANPAIVTIASPSIVLGAGTLSDTATVNGRVNPLAGATITFRLYGPDNLNCTNPAVFAPAAVAYPVAGGGVTSPSFTPVLAGTYRWIASYSGDANNNPVTGVCNDINESVIVIAAAAAPPVITTQASPTITVGSGVLTDTATVTGRVNPLAGATITFRLYGPGDATCMGVPVFTNVVAYPIAGGPVTSGSFAPAQAGTYRWIATYSGDANNVTVTGACNAAGENAEVLMAAASIPIPTLGHLAMLLMMLGVLVAGAFGLRAKAR